MNIILKWIFISLKSVSHFKIICYYSFLIQVRFFNFVYFHLFIYCCFSNLRDLQIYSFYYFKALFCYYQFIIYEIKIVFDPFKIFNDYNEYCLKCLKLESNFIIFTLNLWIINSCYLIECSQMRLSFFIFKLVFYLINPFL